MTRCHPEWFGPGRRLLGWWEVPESGLARAAVLICPSIGQEHASAYRSLRFLAEALADAGFAALRFDYLGTGDSADPDGGVAETEAWLDSVRFAVAHARETVNRPVWVVALRVGCLLLRAAAPGLGDLAGCVLWHPVSSGKGWLRRQTALQRLALGESATGVDVEVPGLTLRPAAAEVLSGWRTTLPLQPGRNLPTLMLRSPDDIQARDITGPGIEVAVTEGPHDLVEVEPVQAQVPVAAIRQISDWIATRAPLDSGVPIRHTDARTTVLGAVRETAGRYGERGTAGVVCEPVSGETRGTLAFLGASDHRIGPGRQWVRWSRHWAPLGLRCVRLDVGGTGDGARHGDETALRYYTDAAVADTLAAIAALRRPGEELALLGLCAGAWTAMRAAETTGVARAYLLNQLVWTRSPLNLGYEPEAVAARAPDGQTRARIWRGRIRRALPAVVAAALDEIGLTNGPMARLAELSRRGTHTTVFLGEGELSGFTVLAGPGWQRRVRPGRVRRRLLRRRGELRVVPVPGMDHAMLSPGGRRAADTEVGRLVHADFALVTGPG